MQVHSYTHLQIGKPSNPYVLINKSILCKCSIKVDNHYLLESLAVCDDANSKLIMYFTINTAFANLFMYVSMFDRIS